MVKLGEPFIHLLQVDSTNNYAHKLVKTNLSASGTAIFAENQTNGRGQVGKKWITNNGENIVVSIIIDISTILLQNQFAVVAMAALGCYDFFSSYAKDGTAIKWSNDLYWNDKKAGGILIETLTQSKKRYAIIGIGININQINFDKSLVNPVSLKQITGKHFSSVNLTKELCLCVDKWYQILLANDFSLILKHYNTYLYKKNQKVVLKKGNIKFECTIKRITAFGELEVEGALQENFKFGEIEWIL